MTPRKLDYSDYNYQFISPQNFSTLANNVSIKNHGLYSILTSDSSGFSIALADVKTPKINDITLYLVSENKSDNKNTIDPIALTSDDLREIYFNSCDATSRSSEEKFTYLTKDQLEKNKIASSDNNDLSDEDDLTADSSDEDETVNILESDNDFDYSKIDESFDYSITDEESDYSAADEEFDYTKVRFNKNEILKINAFINQDINEQEKIRKEKLKEEQFKKEQVKKEQVKKEQVKKEQVKKEQVKNKQQENILNAMKDINYYLKIRAIETDGKNYYSKINDKTTQSFIKARKGRKPFLHASGKDYYKRRNSWEKILCEMQNTIKPSALDNESKLDNLKKIINQEAMNYKGRSGENRYHGLLITLSESIKTLADVEALLPSIKQYSTLYEQMDDIKNSAKKCYKNFIHFPKILGGFSLFQKLKAKNTDLIKSVTNATSTYDKLYQALDDKEKINFLEPQAEMLVESNNIIKC